MMLIRAQVRVAALLLLIGVFAEHAGPIPLFADDAPDLARLSAQWNRQRLEEFNASVELRLVRLSAKGLQDSSFATAKSTEETFTSQDFDLKTLCDVLLDQTQFPYEEPWGVITAHHLRGSIREEHKQPYKTDDEINRILIFNAATSEHITQVFTPYQQVTLQNANSPRGMLSIDRLRFIPNIKDLAAIKVVKRDAASDLLTIEIDGGNSSRTHRIDVTESTGVVRRLESRFRSGDLASVVVNGPALPIKDFWLPSRLLSIDFDKNGISGLEIIVTANFNINAAVNLTTTSGPGIPIFDRRGENGVRHTYTPKVEVTIPDLTPVVVPPSDQEP